MNTDVQTPTRAPVRKGTSEATQTRPDVSTGDGDHDRFAHYIRKSDWTRGYIEGKPIRALCGKRWVPRSDPGRYPLCPTCKEIKAAAQGSGSGDGDGSADG